MNPRSGFNPAAKKVGSRAVVTAVALPRATWHLTCKGGLFVLTPPFFTRKEAREAAKVRGRGEKVVGPFVLAERRGQE